MKTVMLCSLLLILLSIASAATLSVALDGSQDFTSIQAAIEAANNGDTVLVYPGRYYENINYIGKSITVSSLEAHTTDSTYISSTIIDGNQNGPCVTLLNNEQNVTLRGFTITNGVGLPLFYGGYRRGGGILLSQIGHAYITNCIITNNMAVIGGGVYSLKSHLTLSGLQVHNNFATSRGGGMALEGAPSHYPNIIFDPVNRCSVYSNYGSNPVDILITDIRANLQINLEMFTISSPDRFYIARHSNTSLYHQYSDSVDIQTAFRSEVNQDLYVRPDGNDNNTGLSPEQAMKTITKAIHRIAGDSLQVKTVHVLPGVYSDSMNDQILPIPLKSHVNIIGAGSDLTTISANLNGNIGFTTFFCGDRCNNIQLKGFSVETDAREGNQLILLGNLARNVSIVDITTQGMLVNQAGAVLVYELESSSIDSLVIRNITTPEKAFFISVVHSATITNSVFENYHSTYSSPDTPGDDSWGGAMFDVTVSGTLSLINCTFRNFSVLNNQYIVSISRRITITPEILAYADIVGCLFENIRTNSIVPIGFYGTQASIFRVSNCTFYNNYGDKAAVGIDNHVIMRNNIFYNPDAPKEVFIYDAFASYDQFNYLDFDYNIIPGGIQKIDNADPLNTLVYGEHNLDSDPQFAGIQPDEPDYLRLSAFSPAINAGTPDPGDLSLLPYDLAGNLRIWDGRIDLGCYEYGSEPWVSNLDPVVQVPERIVLHQNYPNPFNPTTTISYSLPKAARVRLEVFNIKGQLIKILNDTNQDSGDHSVLWNGKDMNNKSVASGVYFYRLTSPELIQTKKMLLMK